MLNFRLIPSIFPQPFGGCYEFLEIVTSRIGPRAEVAIDGGAGDADARHVISLLESARSRAKELTRFDPIVAAITTAKSHELQAQFLAASEAPESDAVHCWVVPRGWGRGVREPRTPRPAPARSYFGSNWDNCSTLRLLAPRNPSLDIVDT